MTEKMKPCPFCGNKAEVYEECELIKIRCSNYMCQASVNSWHDEVEDAIDAWNKRSAEAAARAWNRRADNYHKGCMEQKKGQWIPNPFEPDWDYCTACRQGTKRREHGTDDGHEWVREYGYRFCPNCGAKMEWEKE